MNLIFADNNYDSMTGLTVEAGKFPDGPNQIMLEKEYLLVHFKVDNVNNMVGKTIKIDNNDYKISGIYYKNSPEVNSNFDCIFNINYLNVSNIGTNKYNLLVEFKENQNIEKSVNNIVGKIGIVDYNQQVTENSNLLTSLGYGTDGKRQSRVDFVTIVLLTLIILIVSLVSVSNTINIFIFKNYKYFAILREIGMSSSEMFSLIIVCIFVLLLVGMVFGILSSIAICNILTVFMPSMYSNSLTIPYLEIAINLISVLFFTVFISGIIIKRTCNLTPLQFFRNSKSESFRNNKKVFKKSFIKNRTKKLKYYFNILDCFLQ